MISALAILAALSGSAAPPGVVVTVSDVNDHGAAETYRGAPLLDSLPPTGPGDQIMIRCRDGFISLLPRDLVARWKPILASEVLVAGEWRPLPPERQPLYLVWPNREHPEIDQNKEINPEGWAWAVMDVQWVSELTLLKPAKSSTKPSVELGRGVWIRTCFHCHALDGVGGLVSWDLAAPTPVWSYLTREKVAAYVRDPRSQNPLSKMPAQKLSAEELSQVMSYLEAAVPARR